MSETAKKLKQELHSIANPEIAEHSKRFFKTGKGEYGESDRFLGIRVPEQRKIARKYKTLPLNEVEKLIQSVYHEERLTALFILEYKYSTATEKQKKEIYKFYLSNLRCINNWDLIDSSAPKIMGAYLHDKSRDILYDLAKSSDLWKRRISIMSTFYFIQNGDFEDTFKIADLMLNDEHDLIHKAVGWMLREIGNKDRNRLEEFLKPCYRKMPRTMLRYAIEKFPEPLRKAYLKGKVL